MNDLPYRPNVCLVILNSENLVFLGERDQAPGHWQLPQGGVEEGCSLEENALREASEELGAPIELFEIIKKLDATYKYDYRVAPDYAVGVYRGQSQTYWLLRYHGSNQEIILDKHHQEFANFIWCEPNQILEISDPIRHKGYKQIIPEINSFLSEEE